jgi:hypothetical protein
VLKQVVAVDLITAPRIWRTVTSSSVAFDEQSNALTRHNLVSRTIMFYAYLEAAAVRRLGFIYFDRFAGLGCSSNGYCVADWHRLLVDPSKALVMIPTITGGDSEMDTPF